MAEKLTAHGREVDNSWQDRSENSYNESQKAAKRKRIKSSQVRTEQ